MLVELLIAVLGSSALSALVSGIISLIAKKMDTKDGYRKGMRLILKDRVKFLCLSYIEQGWVYADELEDLLAMHDCYHTELGGNGYLDALIGKVKALEIRMEGHHEDD